ncbi:MAG: PE family protein [Mycobacterium sp.]|jgi:hypothetical protein
MTGMFFHAPEAANLSAVTEMAISGEMEASTAAGSAALTATTPMVPTADDAAFAAALNSAGAGYVAASHGHVAQRTAYAGAQNLTSLSYVIQELMSATNVNNLI